MPPLTSNGTWNTAGGELILIYPSADHAGEDRMDTYTKPKICGNRFYFGSLQMVERRDGLPWGRRDTYDNATVYERVP